MEDRYSRQILLPEIGAEGQKRLAHSKAVVIGCGALGTHSSSYLVRAGVGSVSVVDRDVIDTTNLQRQTMFEEADVGRPKVHVAVEHLKKINSTIEIRGMHTEINSSNAEKIILGASVVVDATDNMETRFLVNDVCVKNGVPWIYGGAVGVSGMVLVVKGDGPCLRCAFPKLPAPGELPTCDTVGIANTLPGVVAAMEVTEAFKIMMHKDHTEELMILDIWNQEIQKIRLKKNPDCDCCGRHNYEYLAASSRK